MRGGAGDLIGLLIPDVRNDFYSTAAQAISEACARAGFRVVLSITGDDPERERDHLRGLVGARCAGVVVVPGARPLRESLALLARVPHVQLIRHARTLRAPWFGTSTFGLFAPGRTPPQTVGRLNSAFNAALWDPSIQRRLQAMGNMPTGGSVVDFAAQIARDRRLAAGALQGERPRSP